MAEIRWTVASWTELSHRATRSAEARGLVTLKQEAEVEAQQSGLLRSTAALRALLQRCPYWSRGHILFAEHSLQLDDIASAYASLQGVLILPLSKSRSIRAQHLLAQCYLKRGQSEKAAQILLALWAISHHEAIGEDLAAAQMSLGQESEALGVLESIDGKILSQSSHTALTYLKRKKSGTLYATKNN
jgi:hypothetical protein